MEITVSKRFLRVPVKFDGTSHKFTFSENGTPVYKFDAVIRKKTQMRFIMPTCAITLVRR